MGVTFKRAEIPGLFTEEYYSVLRIYNRYKRFGLPFDGGWAQQPEYILHIIESFIQVEESAARAEREKVNANANSRRTHRRNPRGGRARPARHK